MNALVFLGALIGLVSNGLATYLIWSAYKSMQAKDYPKTMAKLLFSIALATLFDFTIK